jgi:hypothetical protein
LYFDGDSKERVIQGKTYNNEITSEADLEIGYKFSDKFTLYLKSFSRNYDQIDDLEGVNFSLKWTPYGNQKGSLEFSVSNKWDSIETLNNTDLKKMNDDTDTFIDVKAIVSSNDNMIKVRRNDKLILEQYSKGNPTVEVVGTS